MKQKIYKAIGLMSGTSLDGAIDVALIETDGAEHVKPLSFYAHPYGAEIRDVVRACFGRRAPDADTAEAERLVTDAHIAAVKASGFEADVVGFHGQTITHAPAAADLTGRDAASGFTWQLGDGARMAEALGIDTVCDFRSADVAAGGQGAPLAPLYHEAIMSAQDAPVAVLNLGGVANVSYIGARHLLAFDCGPANALMDDYMAAHMGQEFDENGVVAQSGVLDRALVDDFLAQDYFEQLPPKSLDRNDFAAVMGRLPEDPKDAMATLMAMSVGGVVAAVKHFPRPPRVWYVCGGGRRNGCMMRLLADALGDVRAVEEAGLDGDAIEAQAFGYLAVRSVLGLPLSMPGTTGVAEPLSGGVFHPVQASRT